MKIKIIGSLLLIILLTGCNYDQLTPEQQKKLSKFSETNYEIDEPNSEFLNDKTSNEPFTDENNSFDEFDEFGDYEMTADDCVEGEEYDPIEKVCFYECETDEECAQKEALINAQLDEIGEEFFSGEKEYLDEQPSEESAIISYSIVNTNLGNSTPGTAQDPNTQAAQQDTQKHTELWQEFKKVASQDFIDSYITTFEIFTDGKEGTLAYVTQEPTNGNKWILGIDIQDAYNEGKLYTKDLHYSLIHEFAHILTLNSSQINFDAQLFNIMNNGTDEEFETAMEKARTSCKTFFVHEGCTKENSYFNQFYQNYWKDIFPEFERIQGLESDSEYENQMNQLYETHQNKFVSDYAVTNPGEDIAESFTYFVLKEKPAGNTIANQKVNFFYQYPELVSLRESIRTNITR